MSDIERRANDWLAKNNDLTTWILLAAVVGPIAWLFAGGTDSQKTSPPIEARAQPKPVTIRDGALICYQWEDWEAMSSGILDNNLAAMRTLLESGKCQQTRGAMSVLYLDPVRGKTALVQMPSGKSAFVFDADIRR